LKTYGLFGFEPTKSQMEQAAASSEFIQNPKLFLFQSKIFMEASGLERGFPPVGIPSKIQFHSPLNFFFVSS